MATKGVGVKVPMMSAVRFDGTGVDVHQIRRVRPATGQILVRVTAVALDRADGEPGVGPRPVRLDTTGHRILGRHVAGAVAAPGAGVDGWPLGRSVVLQPESPAGRGWFVAGVDHDGGLADYVVAPAEAVVALPSDVSPSLGARLALAARAAALLEQAGVSPGASLGIWGAGSLGTAAIAVARVLGAAPVVVVEPREAGRAAALEAGADVVIDPTATEVSARVLEITGRRGLDLALHLAPDPRAAEQAVAGLGPAGRGVLVGPAGSVGGVDRWDGRTLSGPPRVGPDVLPRLLHLVIRGRLHLPEPSPVQGGLPAAARLLDTAVRGGAPVGPHLLTL